MYMPGFVLGDCRVYALEREKLQAEFSGSITVIACTAAIFPMYLNPDQGTVCARTVLESRSASGL